jgi:tellurite resistance protein
MGISTIDLSTHDSGKLKAAIATVIQGAPTALAGHLPSSAKLADGARESGQEEATVASTYFQSLLEIGYLVASADGFAKEEGHALAELLSTVTGSRVSVDALELHFEDLAQACEALGRRERLRRAAEDFDDGLGRGEALGFAALVAVADGRLAPPEAATLKELAQHFGLTDAQLGEAVNDVITRLRSELERKK